MDAITPTSVPEFPLSRFAQAHFTGAIPPFRKLVIRGAFLQLLTLGIYRFWLATDMRRFLWANTEIGGESAEYTGTAMELFLGFLIAIAVLVPIYVLIFIGTLELGLLSRLSSVFAFVFLGGFGQYAYFRARRYRLTRTVFRGVRCHQTGSAARYALRSILWGFLVLLTLGLAYPFAQADLERYKMSCTYYGDLQGSFAGRGSSLFLRGVVLWLIIVGPLAASLVIAAIAVDWQSIGDAIAHGASRDIGRVLQSNTSFKLAMGILGGGFLWLIFAAMLLYPAFQAMVLRWWLAGLRFGDAVVSSRLRTRQVYGAYFRYLGYVTLVTIAASLIIGVMGGVTAAGIKGFGLKTDAITAVVAVAGSAGYVLIALSVWIIYQVAVKLRLWRIMVDSVDIAGLDVIERVQADATQPSSAVGEGLVDALGAGGI
jgi:uncharacterized membrane protein YjgN (DUF898 family)